MHSGHRIIAHYCEIEAADDVWTEGVVETNFDSEFGCSGATTIGSKVDTEAGTADEPEDEPAIIEVCAAIPGSVIIDSCLGIVFDTGSRYVCGTVTGRGVVDGATIGAVGVDNK